MTNKVFGHIRIRRGTAAEWAAENPVLQDGEMTLSQDLNLIKVGDGETAWSSLEYLMNSDVDTIWIPGYNLYNGYATQSGHPGATLISGPEPTYFSTVLIPAHWSTCRVYAHVVPATSGSGNVVIRADLGVTEEGDTLAALNTGSTQAIAVSAANHNKLLVMAMNNSLNVEGTTDKRILTIGLARSTSGFGESATALFVLGLSVDRLT